MEKWYEINNIEQIDTPALAVYPDKILKNIHLVKEIAGNIDKLRPHVKTNKMAEVCQYMIQNGIYKFKCATIAEAEMLGIISADDVLLAYQPVGPKIKRLLSLIKAYPYTKFSCLVDNFLNAEQTDKLCKAEGITLNVFIDLNVGMNRTGIKPDNAIDLIKKIKELKNIHIAGIHAYDGHIHDNDSDNRKKAATETYAAARKICNEAEKLLEYSPVLVIGGTPTFPVHATQNDVECSPGTFVLWDLGYKNMLSDMPFEFAALVISRVISIIDESHICIDLGYKSVASESPLPRVHFLNAPEANPIAQSEEHLVLEVSDCNAYKIGDVLYGVPLHICPTIALYEKTWVITDNLKKTYWKIIARNRYINY